jgi:hypothetical protein
MYAHRATTYHVWHFPFEHRDSFRKNMSHRIDILCVGKNCYKCRKFGSASIFTLCAVPPHVVAIFFFSNTQIHGEFSSHASLSWGNGVILTNMIPYIRHHQKFHTSCEKGVQERAQTGSLFSLRVCSSVGMDKRRIFLQRFMMQTDVQAALAHKHNTTIGWKCLPWPHSENLRFPGFSKYKV